MSNKQFDWNAAFYYALGRQDEKIFVGRSKVSVVAVEFADSYIERELPMHELYREMDNAE